MADRPQRLDLGRLLRSRRGLFAAGAVALVLVAAFALASTRGDGGMTETVVVQAAPLVSTLTVVGVVVPGESREITAPFEGAVTEMRFDYGQTVQAGQVLLVMDAGEARQRQREAQVAYYKALQAAGELSDWERSPEVSRARRTAAAAELELQDTARRLAETKRLLDRGIVPRNEYDSLAQQHRTQQASLAGAREELSRALDRGRGPARTQAGVELEAARARLQDLNEQLARALVIAPAAGVLVRPPQRTDGAFVPVHAGARLLRGQPIATLALTDSFAVSARVDEADAIRLRPGQPVLVTGPGIGDAPIRGVIDHVAGEATSAGADDRTAQFAIRGRLTSLTPEQRQRIRFGMSANMAITLGDRGAGLIVPATAVEGASPDTFVRVKDRGGLRVRRTPVVLGAETAQGVEIVSGLKPGDRVVIARRP